MGGNPTVGMGHETLLFARRGEPSSIDWLIADLIDRHSDDQATVATVRFEEAPPAKLLVPACLINSPSEVINSDCEGAARLFRGSGALDTRRRAYFGMFEDRGDRFPAFAIFRQLDHVDAYFQKFEKKLGEMVIVTVTGRSIRIIQHKPGSRFVDFGRSVTVKRRACWAWVSGWVGSPAGMSTKCDGSRLCGRETPGWGGSNEVGGKCGRKGSIVGTVTRPTP
jgi:hypothetical protein